MAGGQEAAEPQRMPKKADYATNGVGWCEMRRVCDYMCACCMGAGGWVGVSGSNGNASAIVSAISYS